MNVLVTFYCLNGETEKLALAAGLGAVQGRAAIRFRRLRPEPGESAVDERLDQDYVAPKEADARWADAIILGTPSRLAISSPALNEYFGMLTSAGVSGKTCAVLLSNRSVVAGALETLHGAMSALGLKMVAPDLCAVDSADDARLLGRRIAETSASSTA